MQTLRLFCYTVRAVIEFQGDLVRGKLLFVCAIGILLISAALIHPNMLQARPGEPQSASASGACDRACLNNFVDQYLDAVVAHDPSRLPMTKLVKFTENGQHTRAGRRLLANRDGQGSLQVLCGRSGGRPGRV